MIMALWQGKARRTKRGRRIRYARSKKKFEIGREQHHTVIGDLRLKKVRTRGNTQKIRTMSTDIAYIIDPKTGKTTKTNITSVIENRANPHYVRRNIITKGAIIDTKLGKAKVTSRPGQYGTINAVLVSK